MTATTPANCVAVASGRTGELVPLTGIEGHLELVGTWMAFGGGSMYLERCPGLRTGNSYPSQTIQGEQTNDRSAC